MAMFRSNGAALLVLFEILQERLSACGDRPYPTNNVRSASQFFGAFCSGRVNTSFTAQHSCWLVNCERQMLPSFFVGRSP
jgi:hypothetical protein